VFSNFFVAETGQWTSHVGLGKWADLMVIAPCTANTMSKMVTGRCDNLLIATYLSADCPVFFAPAMDLDMYTHPSTTHNINKLKSYGNIELESESGELASGLVGKGRMMEPELVVERLIQFKALGRQLSGKRILVNAGPTFEKLDPVRFIGNYSSGKMGKAIANELASRGAKVDLVLGPVNSDGVASSVTITKVESADEMLQACTAIYPKCNAGILSAAVADYKPATKVNQKIKKKDSTLTLELNKNQDVLKTLGETKQPDQYLVGFALETNNEYENALTKLKKKNLDFIVLNSMQDKGAGFGKDTNKVTLINRNGESNNFDTKPKTEVAIDIVDALAQYICKD